MTEKTPPAPSSGDTDPAQPAVDLEKLSRANAVQPGKPASDQAGHAERDREEAANRFKPNQQ